jgi:hypothetical protein
MDAPDRARTRRDFGARGVYKEGDMAELRAPFRQEVAARSPGATTIDRTRSGRDKRTAMPTLLFVYNADGGLFNLLADMAHKALSPQTYACRLCALTHGAFGMRDDWKRFLQGVESPKVFLHRDEFRRAYGLDDVALPAVFRKEDDGRVEPLLTAIEIDATGSLDDLKRLLSERLSAG